MKIKLSNINILPAFKQSFPSDRKLLKCMTYFAKHKKLDRDIVLDKNNTLVDGYVAYLTLKSLGIKKCKYVKDENYQWYVQGKHPGKDKIYTWKLPESLIVNGLPKIHTGKTCLIRTSIGLDSVRITRVFMSNKSPIDGNILNFTLA